MIVVMKDGAVSEQGSYDELLDRDGAFAEFIKNYLIETEGLSEDEMLTDTGITPPHKYTFKFDLVSDACIFVAY